MLYYNMATSPIDFTAPINLITTGNFTTCIRKCEYVVGYKLSSFQIEVKNDHLLFKPLFGYATMMYNGTTYAIYDMRLYLGHLHSWDGNGSDGELQITHKTLNGDNTLIVCIPIMRGGAGPSVNDLIDPVRKADPSVDYDVSRLIPNTRYYSYNGTGQFNKSFTGITYVLFDKTNALSISDIKFDELGDDYLSGGIGLSTIDFDDQDSPRMQSDASEASPVLYSSDVPKSGQGVLDDIYIECKPTGDEGEEAVDRTTGSGGYNFHLSTALQNEIVQWIMKVVVGIFVIVCVLRIFDSFSKKVLVTKAP